MAAIAIALALISSGTVIHASGGWAAIDRGRVCEALSRSLRKPAIGQPSGVAGIAFDADRRPWGQFHARLGRVPRAGSTVVLNLGGQPYLLAARGTDVWARNSAQDRAIIDALRDATAMSVAARDSNGRRFSDVFDTRGAATAIDAAAARCAGKRR